MPQPRSIPGRYRGCSEVSETCQVDFGGKAAEVGTDFVGATNACSSSSVLASHEVAEFSFDLGPGRPVVGDPLGLLLTSTCSGKHRFVQPDGNVATLGRLGALRTERTRITRTGELGQTTTFDMSSDRDDDPIGTGDGVVFEVDHEAVLGKEPDPGDRLLGLALRLDTFVFEAGLERASAKGTVPVDGVGVTSLGVAGIFIENHNIDNLVVGRSAAFVIIGVVVCVCEQIGDEVTGHASV
jgi:hypothetical protein